MSHFLDVVSSSPASYGIVFVVVLLDALLPFVQAEAVVISASVLAAEGHLRIWLIIPVAALAGVAGDNLSYSVGKSVGPRLIASLSVLKRRRRNLEAARRGIQRRGSLLIVVARFLPVGRTLTTLAAGSLKMPWRRFLAADAIAASAWAVYAALLGFIGGSTFEHGLWKALVVSLGIAGLLGVVTEVFRRLQKRRGRDLLAGELR